MKSIRILLVATAISCVTFFSGCEKDPPPVERKPDTLTYLKSFDIYDIGEHPCTVRTSLDSYSYLYRYGSDGYINLSQSQQKINDLVPLSSIESMSTLGLIETMLENPTFCPLYFIANDFPDFITYFEKECSPGLWEKLYQREDAASLLVERYVNMYPTCTDNNYSSAYGKGNPIGDTSDGVISTAFMSIQTLLAEDSIIYQLSEEELLEVSIHIVKTYISVMENNKLEYPYSFNIFGAAWLATRIMEISEYRPFIDLRESTYNRLSIRKYRNIFPAGYAHLMLCFNDFIQEKL